MNGTWRVNQTLSIFLIHSSSNPNKPKRTLLSHRPNSTPFFISHLFPCKYLSLFLPCHTSTFNPWLLCWKLSRFLAPPRLWLRSLLLPSPVAGPPFASLSLEALRSVPPLRLLPAPNSLSAEIGLSTRLGIPLLRVSTVSIFTDYVRSMLYVCGREIDFAVRWL